MTTISAKIVADSIAPSGQRLTTFQLLYPRFIHAELMTHRVFSRNASSSRAIPVETMLGNIVADPAMPVKWGRNQPGMQDAGELTVVEQEYCQEIWEEAMHNAIASARKFLKMPNQPHKQCVNRLLEPFMHIAVLVTSTNYSNWFALRRHGDADPTIKRLAGTMWDAWIKAPQPTELRHGDWHLPYVDQDTVDEIVMHVAQTYAIDSNEEDFESIAVETACKVSAARCARVSYLNHDGTKCDIEKDLRLFDLLMANIIKHASPTEHQGTPDAYLDQGRGWANPKLHGNFNGWIQFRKTLPDEFVSPKRYMQLDAEGFFR